MAQAARLSLRMQKELKLLLTDPPPGVSLPLLSADSDSSNLSSIDAQIDGPEGTVYAKGVFNVKIVIPDRYPFQPPIVTFATPVYHPNIDNGGRICLDILNLPPKGAWQPSLNISTVLTSLGLLLSEPNPDDGLMCEASREYKYNRQAFDQKARSMTEQFAMAGGSMNHSSGGGSGSMSCNTNPSTKQAEGSETESKSMVNESSLSHKKLQVCWKLSLQSSGLSQRTAADKKEAAMAGDHDVHKPHKDQVTGGENGGENGIFRKPRGISRKLSLESSGLSQSRDAYDRNRLSVDQQLPSKNHCTALSEPLEMPKVDNLDEKSHHDRKGAGSGISRIRKKLGQISQNTSLNSLGSENRMDDEKENMEPAHRLLVSHSQSEGLSRLYASNPQPVPQCGNRDEQDNVDQNVKVSNATINVCPKKVYNAGANLSLETLGSLRRDDDEEENQVISLLPLHSQRNGVSPKSRSHAFNSNGQHQHHEVKFVNSCIKQQEEHISPVTETVIVLDSEDSEEENRGLKRSRLSLARKRPTKAKTCT